MLEKPKLPFNQQVLRGFPSPLSLGLSALGIFKSDSRGTDVDDTHEDGTTRSKTISDSAMGRTHSVQNLGIRVTAADEDDGGSAGVVDGAERLNKETNAIVGIADSIREFRFKRQEPSTLFKSSNFLECLSVLNISLDRNAFNDTHAEYKAIENICDHIEEDLFSRLQKTRGALFDLDRLNNQPDHPLFRQYHVLRRTYKDLRHSRSTPYLEMPNHKELLDETMIMVVNAGTNYANVVKATKQYAAVLTRMAEIDHIALIDHFGNICAASILIEGMLKRLDDDSYAYSEILPTSIMIPLRGSKHYRSNEDVLEDLQKICDLLLTKEVDPIDGISHSNVQEVYDFIRSLRKEVTARF